jgi:hypothetical protein
MASATLNIKVSPRRMLSPREAAEYCGLAPKRFPQECCVPPVSMPTGTKLYDMRDLDLWLDSLKSGDPTGDDELLGKLG